MTRRATTAQARSLRRRATLAERMLWNSLRDRRLAGLKFRRQVPFGLYVLDLVCFEHRLIVEADGPFHDPAKDAARDAFLAAQGFRTLRLPNKLILGGGPQVAEAILNFLLPSWEKVSAKLTDEGPAPPPQPLIRPAPQATFSREGRRGEAHRKTPPTSPPAGFSSQPQR